MSNKPPDILVTDTSVLVNFLAVDRIDLFASHQANFLITDHVSTEITDHYPEERFRLQQALNQEIIRQISVDDPMEQAFFGQLGQNKRLGAGECSAIAIAIHRGYRLAIDDKRAIKQALLVAPQLQIVTTQDLVVELISQGIMDITSADTIKAIWEIEHRFRLKIASFAECFSTPEESILDQQ